MSTPKRSLAQTLPLALRHSLLHQRGGGGGGAIFHQSTFEWSISRSVSSKLVHLFVFGTIFPMMSLFISRHDRVRCRADRATWITTDRYWERKHSIPGLTFFLSTVYFLFYANFVASHGKAQ